MFLKRCGIFFVTILPIAFLSTRMQAQSWTQLTTTGGPPSVRNAQSTIYDAGNNGMYIFGGYGNTSSGLNYLNDSWALSNANGLGGTPGWVELTIQNSPPAPRYGNSAIFDISDDVMIIYGGWAGTTVFDDVWENIDFDNWTQSQDASAGARYGHTAVFDQVNKLMTVFGGKNGTTYFNDTWVAGGLTGVSPDWTQLSTAGTPPARFSHTAVYYSVNNLMTIFGGYGTVSPHNMNDAWVSSNANGLDSTTPTWTQLSTTGVPPPPRYYHTAVYDSTENKMIIYGGWDATTVYSDLWVLSHANGLGGTPTWSQLSTSGNAPGPLYGHGAIYDNVNELMTVFGGYDGSTYHNDTWVLNLSGALPVKDWVLYSTPLDKSRVWDIP